MLKKMFERVILIVFSAVLVSSSCWGNDNTAKDKNFWERALILWQSVDYYPTEETSSRFYSFICQAPKTGEIDLSWFTDSYRFSYEVLCGNKYMAKTGLKMAMFSKEDQRKKIVGILAKLIRINPEIFLEVLVNEKGLKIEEIRQIVTTLPEENEYLFKKSYLFSGDLAAKLAYFGYYEIAKRIEALEKINSKKTSKIKNLCLDLLKDELNKRKTEYLFETDFKTAVNILEELWNLPIEDKWLIFDEPLPRHKMNFDLIHRNYYDYVLWPIAEYESYAGNESALRAILFDIKTTVLYRVEFHLWELSRIKPALFVKVLCSVPEERMGVFKAYLNSVLEDRGTLTKIAELQHRINVLSRVRVVEKKCDNVRKSYIDIFKKQIKVLKDKLKGKSDMKIALIIEN